MTDGANPDSSTTIVAGPTRNVVFLTCALDGLATMGACLMDADIEWKEHDEMG